MSEWSRTRQVRTRNTIKRIMRLLCSDDWVSSHEISKTCDVPVHAIARILVGLDIETKYRVNSKVYPYKMLFYRVKPSDASDGGKIRLVSGSETESKKDGGIQKIENK